ncbi:sulfopyruvate decarboxylase subunit alpha [Methanolobus zinderi]|uniref:sulfopyruvate decarboxylase n=1 Tax=Methanolobus zinderi TaxID=536044 RepID=A0A7D5I5D8_9EURY|nr:sulfopyruvate decarboxylase subunit alpha [Methanolobus zinderi]KXS40519.1 MAG: sulfopyruvate decarboxylase subunit alpha [Methanolobus sp. T82-4]QLC50808.1 sulfopyruvate decarboxylase subunit alpha [Methanolobus zinderi]
MSAQKVITPSEAVYQGIKDAGIDFIVSVPCANLKELIPMVDSDPDIIHVPVTREEEGVGVCAGAYMGGKRPAMLMQNSGLGNSINALASLDILYGIPLLMIMSHRGVEGEPIVAQVPMGQLTAPLLETLKIPYFLPGTKQDATDMIITAMDDAFNKNKPVAVLLPIPFWRQA